MSSAVVPGDWILWLELGWHNIVHVLPKEGWRFWVSGWEFLCLDPFTFLCVGCPDIDTLWIERRTLGRREGAISREAQVKLDPVGIGRQCSASNSFGIKSPVTLANTSLYYGLLWGTKKL